MSQNREPAGFFDKNTFLAIVLSFAVFFVWQKYMLKKYPKKASNSVITQQATTPVSSSQTPTENIPAKLSISEAQKISFDSETMSFDISNHGMAITSLKLKKFAKRDGESIVYEGPLDFKTFNSTKIYNLEKTSENEFIGTSNEAQEQKQITIKVEPEKYLFTIVAKIKTLNKTKTKLISENQNEVREMKKGFLLPPTDYQEFFVDNLEKIKREKLNPETDSKTSYDKVQLLGLNAQYFALTQINKTDIYPRAETSVSQKTAYTQWHYETAQPIEEQTFHYSFYVGPKNEEIMSSVSPELTKTIDYGIFGFLGRPMHKGLIYAYKFVGNWGLAIILVTLILRALTLPIGVYSFRSMKKMQKIQPKLQAIKEKYKNDPQKINQETIQLMRTEKANPLSGCIPALMQIPIFIAFFSMMSSSFELYMQPFYFWIKDLSAKDPFFIFPILAGAGMFVQQKLTPMTTTDPAQAKVMAMMPLLMILFMLSTPSGLALYMFVGSIFTIFQQLMFMKERTT